MIQQIREELFRMKDEKYRELQKKLIPTADSGAVIGVRTPDLRQYAKQLVKREEITVFLRDLPHRYFDEDQLHAFIVSELKDYDRCADEVDRFLPYVNNWATCDQMSPKVFKKDKERLLEHIKAWIASGKTYTVRFGIGMLMQHFLDEGFRPEYPGLAAGISSDEYYVRMMQAWYFATALAKQYDAVIPYIEERRLEKWTHNKAIQKALESFRITPEQKEYLRSLKIK